MIADVFRTIRIGFKVIAVFAIINNVFGVGVGVEFLAALHFGGDRREHPLHRRFVEVRDHFDGVRQVNKRRERATAFVIHQHKIKDTRIVIARQTDDQCHQEF